MDWLSHTRLSTYHDRCCEKPWTMRRVLAVAVLYNLDRLVLLLCLFWGLSRIWVFVRIADFSNSFHPFIDKSRQAL